MDKSNLERIRLKKLEQLHGQVRVFRDRLEGMFQQAYDMDALMAKYISSVANKTPNDIYRLLENDSKIDPALKKVKEIIPRIRKEHLYKHLMEVVYAVTKLLRTIENEMNKKMNPQPSQGGGMIWIEEEIHQQPQVIVGGEWEIDWDDVPQTIFVDDIHNTKWSGDTVPPHGTVIQTHGSNIFFDDVRIVTSQLEAIEYEVQHPEWWVTVTVNGEDIEVPMAEDEVDPLKFLATLGLNPDKRKVPEKVGKDDISKMLAKLLKIKKSFPKFYKNFQSILHPLTAFLSVLKAIIGDKTINLGKLNDEMTKIEQLDHNNLVKKENLEKINRGLVLYSNVVSLFDTLK